jgi:ATP-dependent Lhr-like helicase
MGVAFLHEAHAMDWDLVEVPTVSPFAFGLYASKIRESLMMESPEEAIERLYREMQRKTLTGPGPSAEREPRG